MDIQQPGFRQLIMGANSRLELWARILQDCGAETVAEVGVWKGEYARYVLQYCKSIQRYYLIDPWENLPDWNKPFNVSSDAFRRVYDEAMENTAFAEAKRIVLRGRTKDVISNIQDNSLDFAYIDGDHTLRGITIDLIKILPKIREGGYLAGDDFSANQWQHGPDYEPTLVFPFGIHFAEAMNLPIMALPFNQFVIQKSSVLTFAFIDTTDRYGNMSIKPPPPIRRASAIKRRISKLLTWNEAGKSSHDQHWLSSSPKLFDTLSCAATGHQRPPGRGGYGQCPWQADPLTMSSYAD